MEQLRDDFTVIDHDGFDHNMLDHCASDSDPPPPIVQAERRMQARAYTLWASLLRGRDVPRFADCRAQQLSDLAAHSVILDLNTNEVNPAVRGLGETLAEQCDIAAPMTRLSQAPEASLLATLADRIGRCVASRAPFGFESEIVNQRGVMVLYRGIVLPFASDGAAIDVLLCAVSWKEVADPELVAALQREMRRAFVAAPIVPRSDAPLAEWADGPAAEGVEHPGDDQGPAALAEIAHALNAEAEAAERHARELRATATAARLRAREACARTA